MDCGPALLLAAVLHEGRAPELRPAGHPFRDRGRDGLAGLDLHLERVDRLTGDVLHERHRALEYRGRGDGDRADGVAGGAPAQEPSASSGSD